MSPISVPLPLMSAALDLETLVSRHQVGVWRYLRALGAPADLAEDLLQDVFLVAFRRLTDDRDAVAVAAFLRRTARHLYLRRRRDQGRREELLVELADRLWERDCGDDGEAWIQAARACVEQLDGRPRRVVELFYGEGLGRDAIAAATGMRKNGVKTLLQRVRARLRECIERRTGATR